MSLTTRPLAKTGESQEDRIIQDPQRSTRRKMGARKIIAEDGLPVPGSPSSLRRQGLVQGQGNPHHASLPGLGREDLQLAAMRFNNLAAHGQTEAQTDVAGREERRGDLVSGFGREAGAVVLDFDLQ